MDRRILLKSGLAGIGGMVLARPVGAMQNFLQAEEKKTWAVVYHSVCGSTKDAATWINDALGGIADIVDIDSKPTADDYEYFVIGGCIQGGKVSNSLSNFVKNNKATLKDKLKGFFTVCGNMGKDYPLVDAAHENYSKTNLGDPSGITDIPSKVFVGRAKKDCSASSSIIGMTGEFDFLKESDCVAFGQTILSTAIASRKQDASLHFGLSANSTATLPVTNTRYSLAHAGYVTLSLCDLRGRTVAILTEGYRNAGTYNVPWNTRTVAPGQYLYRLNMGKFETTRLVNIIDR